ncbi:MAG: hypothetical protein AAF291_01160 [Pseudomonadota bacterium]
MAVTLFVNHLGTYIAKIIAIYNENPLSSHCADPANFEQMDHRKLQEQIGPNRPMWYGLHMAQNDDQNDFDFGFQPGIDTFAQNGIPTATAIDRSVGEDDLQHEGQQSHSSSILFAVVTIGIGIAVFGMRYFF